MGETFYSFTGYLSRKRLPVFPEEKAYDEGLDEILAGEILEEGSLELSILRVAQGLRFRTDLLKRELRGTQLRLHKVGQSQVENNALKSQVEDAERYAAKLERDMAKLRNKHFEAGDNVEVDGHDAYFWRNDAARMKAFIKAHIRKETQGKSPGQPEETP